MAILTLILGECASGKTTSIRTLNPDETFIINIEDKPLPFRNFKNNFRSAPEGDKKVNYYASDNALKIVGAINKISQSRPDIKYLIIDDFGYLMSNEFFSRASEKGFAKFSEIGQHAWIVLNALKNAREDLYGFLLAHNELTPDGKYKIRTIGKMLDEKCNIEGKFPHIFHALIVEGEYKFLTRNDGTHMGRSPLDMFKNDYIDNDLSKIIKVYEEYYGKIETPKIQIATPMVNPYETLLFLLEHSDVSKETIENVCTKYKVSTIFQLPLEMVNKWITKLSESVDMRNDQ